MWDIYSKCPVSVLRFKRIISPCILILIFFTPPLLSVDASEAGSGNIEILVNKGRIACSVQNLGSYKFLASFLPQKAERHTVEMKFNNLPVVGEFKLGFFKIDAEYQNVLYIYNNIFRISI